MKEIRYELITGRKISKFTNRETLLTNYPDGLNMIGFIEIGEKTYSWLPIGENVVRISVYDAESGRKITDLL